MALRILLEKDGWAFKVIFSEEGIMDPRKLKHFPKLIEPLGLSKEDMDLIRTFCVKFLLEFPAKKGEK